jgi:uncharacterized protein YbjT (DUF2867 family)
MLVLVTGATGKGGQVFLDRILKEPRWENARVRALCHNRVVQPRDQLEIAEVRFRIVMSLTVRWLA